MAPMGLGVGADAKRRATLRTAVASLHATVGPGFVTPVEPRRTPTVRTVGTTRGGVV